MGTVFTTSSQIPETTRALRDHYAKIYGEPKNDEDAITTLSEILKELMNYNFLTMEIKDGIGEYYRLIQAKELPAFEWMLEAFHVVSKKEESKRTFPYIVGILRQWLKNGFGYIPNKEEDEIIDYFQETIEQDEISNESRTIIRKLMSIYGSVKVTRMIGSLKKESDMSKLMAFALGDLLSGRYDETRTK